MSLKKLPNEFIEALPVLTSLEEAGFEAYFVGGSVRDFILGKPIHDVDIATSAYPEEVKKIFSRTIDVGIEHGTVLALIDDDQYEITTFRTESTYQDYRRPDSVNFVRSLSEDLKRRDFTINALAMNREGHIIDLFNGVEDLKKGLIRAVGKPQERFTEDALRVMRGLRFASQLGFKIEEETIAGIEATVPLLAKISVERIHIEFIKLLLGDNRENGLKYFIKTESFNYCPRLKNQREMLVTLSELKQRPFESESQAWLIVTFLLGLKPQEVRTWLREWKLSNQLIKNVQELLEGFIIRKEDIWTNDLLFDLGLEKALLIELTLSYFDIPSDTEQTKNQYLNLSIKSIQDLAVNGQLLLEETGENPGPWLGRMIDNLKSAVLSDSVPNTKEALIQLTKNIIQNEG